MFGFQQIYTTHVCNNTTVHILDKLHYLFDLGVLGEIVYTQITV